MPRYKKQREQIYIDRVRAVLAFNPRASARFIKTQLEDDWRNPITLGEKYIVQLRDKIRKQQVFKADTTRVAERIGQMQETASAVIEKMVEILLSAGSDDKAKIMAGKLILEADRELFKAEMDAGIFERQLGTLAMKHKLVLEPERRETIVLAMRNLGLIKQKTINVQATIAPSTGGAEQSS